MEAILLDALLEEKISKKGKPYYVITVNLTDNLDKQVFLDKAEVELVKLVHGCK